MKGLLKRVERAEDGFCVSFDPNDPNALAHMAEFGFCVVKVLSPAECAATRAEFFHEVNVRTKAMGKEVPVDPADPSTWEDANWQFGKRLVDFPAVSQCALANRTHPNLYQFYWHLLGTSHIAGNVDVWGVMRGTAMFHARPSGVAHTAPPALGCKSMVVRRRDKRGFARGCIKVSLRLWTVHSNCAGVSITYELFGDQFATNPLPGIAFHAYTEHMAISIEKNQKNF